MLDPPPRDAQLTKSMKSAPDAARVLIADDHPLFREAIREVVTRVRPHAHVVEASTYDEVLAHTRVDERYDLIVVDLMMPGGDELLQLARLRDRVPATPIVVVSSRDDVMTIRSTLRCGIAAYLRKSSARSVMERAIRAVLAGETWIPDDVAIDAERHDLADGGEALTRRQQAVLEQLALGNSNRQIAHDLGIEEITVKAHISAILRKLHVKNRVQAVLVSREYLENNKAR